MVWHTTLSPYTSSSVMTFGATKAPMHEKGTQSPTASRFTKTVPATPRTSRPTHTKSLFSESKPAKISAGAPFKIRQSVKHAVFGIGLVTEIEEKSNDVFFVTVSFKAGKKKLDSKFFLTQV